MKSWDDCYLFFQEKLPQYIASPAKNKDFPDEATLHLAFYLASFGMFRGSLPYLQYSKNIFRAPLLDTFDLLKSNGGAFCSLSAKNVDPKLLFELQACFKASLKASLRTAGYAGKSQPSELLLEKVFLGIFACVPALDRFATKGLKTLKEIDNSIKEIQTLHSPFASLESLHNWISFASKISEFKAFQDLEPVFLEGQPYPVIRKVDLILWSVGKYEYSKLKNKQKVTRDE